MNETKEQTLQLSDDYIVGFVDGEGCFCVSISKHKTMRQRREIRLLFEIEVREDDAEILDAIRRQLHCGSLYRLTYSRYHTWKPHSKLKVPSIKDIVQYIIPFFDQHPLQAKKRKSYQLFREIAFMVRDKKHLN